MFERGWVGAGVLVYDLPMHIFVASSRVVPIICVWVLCPYYRLGLCLGYCGCLTYLVVLVLLKLLRGIRVDCIWGGVGVG